MLLAFPRVNVLTHPPGVRDFTNPLSNIASSVVT